MTVSLTPNAILALKNGVIDLHPVLQIIDIKQISDGLAAHKRYCLVFSDGSFFHRAMLASQLNEFVQTGKVQKTSVVKLLQYACTTVQQRETIIVLQIEVVAAISVIIGNPKQDIANEQSLSASVPGNPQHQRQQQQRRPEMQELAQQPQLYNNLTNGRYDCARDAGLRPMNGLFGKESPLPSYSSPVSNFSQPALYQRQRFGSTGGIAEKIVGVPYDRSVDTSVSDQPASLFPCRDTIAMNEEPVSIIPIASLNPFQGRWVIKARVTAKSELRTFVKAKGEGKVFHFEVLDAGGEIRVTCFNAAADQYFNSVELGKLYVISKGSLKPANKSFNHLKNDWEILLENWSTVEPCLKEDNSIPHQRLDFKPICEIESMAVNEIINIIGVVEAISPTSMTVRRNGKQVQKKNLQLRDTSGRSVEVTIWGFFCAKEGQQLQDLRDSGHFPVLAVVAGRISEFSGKHVGTTSSSQLLVNPNLYQACQVKEWFEQVGRKTAPLPLSREEDMAVRIDMRKTLSQITSEGLGKSEKADWIILKATISFVVSDNFCYTACPLPAGDRQCRKKVINTGEGTWRCDRCDKDSADCDYRYLLSLHVQDHTGKRWITAFDEAGKVIMGVSAMDLYMWKQQENPRYEGLIRSVNFSKHLFKLKVEEETYNDEQRVKCTVVKSEKLNYVAESRVLIDLIGKLSGREPTNVVTSNVAGTSGYGGDGGYGVARTGQAEAFGGGNYCEIVNNGPIPKSFAEGHAGHGGYGVARTGQAGALGRGSYCETLNNGPVLNSFAKGHANGFTSSYGGGISCFRCGGGHMARDCPKEVLMGRNCGYSTGFNGDNSTGNTNACFKCGQGGHWARDCHSQVGTRDFGYGGYGKNGGYAYRGN